MNKTIALCGAHGTGKTTLLNELIQTHTVVPLSKTVRTFWEDNGISDFEKLPPEVRNVFQKHLLMNQIEREDAQWEDGFITDRSVLDYMGYTVTSSDMSGIEKRFFEQLVKERLTRYDYFIYLPVEFPAEPEYLRAHPKLQQRVADVLEEYLEKWLRPDQYCVARGSVQDRINIIEAFMSHPPRS